MSASANTSSASSHPLKPIPFESRVDPSFWFALSSLKLNSWKLDASPKHAAGHYRAAPRAATSQSHPRDSSEHDTFMEFNAHSFDGTYIPRPHPLLILFCGRSGG